MFHSNKNEEQAAVDFKFSFGRRLFNLKWLFHKWIKTYLLSFYVLIYLQNGVNMCLTIDWILSLQSHYVAYSRKSLQHLFDHDTKAP